jgi:hypothetical protein
MRVAPQVVLTEEQQRTLQQWARTRSLPSRQVERARVILLAATGKQDLEVAAEIGISNQKAARWRKRFLKFGLAGLEKDAPRPGRAPTITSAKPRKWFGKPAKKPTSQLTGARAPQRKAVGLSERACAASG